jgi:hypothetical protein
VLEGFAGIPRGEFGAVVSKGLCEHAGIVRETLPFGGIDPVPPDRVPTTVEGMCRPDPPADTSSPIGNATVRSAVTARPTRRSRGGTNEDVAGLSLERGRQSRQIDAVEQWREAVPRPRPHRYGERHAADDSLREQGFYR